MRDARATIARRPPAVVSSASLVLAVPDPSPRAPAAVCVAQRCRTSTKNQHMSPPRRSFVVLLAMFVATVPFALDMYLPGLPSIAAEFGADAGAAAHSVSAFLFGLAAGQLLMGPLSDKYGRHAVLGVSLLIFTVASVACARATSITHLIAFRVVEAMGAGAAAVIVNALVRDLYEERASASVMSFVFMVMLVAPLFAPIIGGHLIEISGWRLIFWVLSAYGVLCLLAQQTLLARDADPGHKRAITSGELLRAYGRVLVHPAAMGYNLAAACAGAVLFSFITGSSFLYMGTYGVSPASFGYLFAVNVVTLMGFSSLNRVLVHKYPLRTLILSGCAIQLLAAGALALGVWTHSFALPAAVACVAVTIGGMGLIGANGTSAMLGYFPHTTGTTAAVAGISRFLLGALASSAVGFAHDGGGRGMVLVMVASAVAAILSILMLTPRGAAAAAT
jgi:MFS transporter, DHA1 family, multidrug resistance protein